MSPRGIRFESIDTDFVALLGLSDPPFTARDDSFRQLRYIQTFLRDKEIACQSVVVEEWYVDRDHMEDHAAFYSRSLHGYPNHCKRLHFFRAAPRTIQTKLKAIIRQAAKHDAAWLQARCRQLSDDQYLGFCVVRPLHGCPVGRTVLRTFPENGDTGFHRAFRCTRCYTAHLAGLTLTVCGLPFQQQDKAVAACATTAVWSSLHMVRAHETIAMPSPSTITTRATQNSMPFGRSMPSEGLSVDQMCQAVHASGVSPLLLVARDYETTRGLLYSAIRSGLSPVVVLNRGEDWHAVAVAGMKLTTGRVFPYQRVIDDASRLEALYVHDDRIGPYLRANLEKALGTGSRNDSQLDLAIRFDAHKGLPDELWRVTHLLLPLHLKIRTSLFRLRKIAEHVARDVLGAIDQVVKSAPVTQDIFIERGERYLQGLLVTPRRPSNGSFWKLATDVPLARYVGIIRITTPYEDVLDVLIDMTGTDKNPNPLAVICIVQGGDSAPYLVDYLRVKYRCPGIDA